MSLLFVMLIVRIVNRGPDDGTAEQEPTTAAPEPAGAA